MNGARILYRTVDCGNPLPTLAIAADTALLAAADCHVGRKAGSRKARA
jgi:hypothetical protein